MLDSGSPISFVKSSFIPVEARTPLPENNYEFAGIIGSRMEILGFVEREVEVESIPIKLRLYVVPDHTMAYMAILGRDFSSNPLIKVSVDNGLKVSRKESKTTNEFDSTIAQILNIDCMSEPVTAPEKLRINPEIDPAVAENIKELYRSDYQHIKESSTDSIDFEMKIVLKHDQPINFRPLRLSYADKEKLQIILDELLARKIIRPSESPYSSPIVLVRKKSGELRLCVDFRELNKITIKDNFPSQLIDDNIDRLKNKRHYTILDLKDGYYNVRMAEESIEFTSFVTPLGQYEFLFCPFGLINAPKVFARFVQKMFSDLIRAGKLLVYFDDFLIATETLEEHLEILKKVFQTAGRYRLTFKLSKCAFAQSEVDYLSYRVSIEGIRPNDDNIKAVLNYPCPRKTKDVLRFVSLASYFRRFIPGFSIIAKPLYDLVKKKAKFVFEEKENEAFETLKNHLANKPILSIYSPTAETEIHCDASTSGFGAIVLQKQADGCRKPIAYYSQRTTPYFSSEGNTFEQTLSICQDKDPEIRKIRDELEKTELKHFELRNGLVYRKDRSKKLLFYVPRSMEDKVIRTCHDDLGHVGQDKIINNIVKLYWFPDLRGKIREYISNCLRCIEFSLPNGKQEGYLYNIDKGKVPFHILHIDHLGPLEKREEATDICYAPKRIITDRGTAFTSKTFNEFLTNENVQHTLIAVGTPRANGQVERFNRTIVPMLAKLCETPSKWDRVLEQVEFALNNTVCRTTIETPSRLLFGVEQLGKLNDCLRPILESMSSEERNLEAIRERAAKNTEKVQAANEECYNNKRKIALVYNVGDYVMIKNIDTSAGINKKLIPKFKGPYVVKKVLDCDRYVISDIEGFQVTQMPYNGVLSPDNMKPYIAV
ncbi:Transposon Ty3-I Gag-Pol polyprotein [Anthophora plagiata]